MATQKFLNETGLQHYTELVKNAIEEAKKTAKQNVIANSATTKMPVILSKQDESTVATATDEVNTSPLIYFQPSTGTLTVEDGQGNTASLSPSGGSAGDASKTVKQNAESGSTALPILTSHNSNPSDGGVYEAGFDTDLKFTPNSNTLTVKTATTTVQGVTITPSSIKVGTTATNGASELTSSQLKVGSATLTSTAYSGKATQTETDLNTYGSGKGAKMVKYKSSSNVEDGIDAAAKTVEQVSTATSQADAIPVILGGASLTNNVGNVRKTTDITYKPSTRETTINTNGETAQSSASFVFGSGKLNFGSNRSLSPTEYTGKALQTETDLKAFYAKNLEELGDGANEIGYFNPYAETGEESTTVGEALSDIYATIGGGGGGGGDDFASRITALEGKTTNINAAGTTFSGTASNATNAVTATNLANAPAINITAGTASDAPKVNVTAGGKSGTAQAITKASVSAYGVVRLAQYTSPEDDSDNDSFVPSLGIVKTLVRQTNQAQFVVTDYTSPSQLPSVTSAQDAAPYRGKIYLIKNTDVGGANNNIYDEYILVQSLTTPVTFTWELLGTTDAGVDVVSLTTSEINTIWSTTVAAS